MAITTYAELKSAIQGWSKRTDTLTVIDDFIDLAEADIWQRLTIRDMEGRATAATSTTTRFLELPSGFLSMRSFTIEVDDEEYPIRSNTTGSMPVYSDAGIPIEFCITSEIAFNRVSDQAYTVQMQYFKSLDALSASNTTNAVLARFPMIYLYGALFHFANWAQDDEMVQKYALLFDGAVTTANSKDRRGRYGPSPSVKMRVSTP